MKDFFFHFCFFYLVKNDFIVHPSSQAKPSNQDNAKNLIYIQT